MKKASYFNMFQQGNETAGRRQGRNGMNEHAKIDGMMIDFNGLITSLSRINNDLREQSIRAVNTSLTMRNWFFGFYIFEFEQHGKDRASYNEALLTNISKEMKGHGISGVEERQLRGYRQFYLTYPTAGNFMGNELRIRLTLSAELLQSRETNDNSPIRDSVNPEFQIPDNHYISLFGSVSFNHFLDLIRLDDPIKRFFYELECMKGDWSVRELRRQIGSLLYERTGLSKNKEKLLAMVQPTPATNTIADTIRDPYIFEFLGLKQQDVLPEKELEQALLDNLQQFCWNWAKVFALKPGKNALPLTRSTTSSTWFVYHRLLHCNVLVELKTERFNHVHASQLNMYVEYYKRYEMAEGDQPPVGILLCTGKDQEHVEFATAGLDDKLFVAKYLVALPGKKELEQFIKNELAKR